MGDIDETRLTDPDGNSGAVFQVDTIRLHSGGGNGSETIVMATDVSDLVRVQRELAVMNTELAQRNAELDQFAHLASHDLRAPLRAIHAFGQMAVDQTGPSDNLDRVLAGVERMRRMLDSLLAYAESGRQTLAVVETDLGAVFAAAMDDLAADIAANDAVIQVDDLPRITCDPVQFRGLFQNLLQNAIQYAGDAPPRVEVTSEVMGDQLAIEFVDHGVGVRPGARRRGLRALPAARSLEQRPGHRARDLPPRDRTARRPDLGQLRAGQGRPVLAAPPAHPGGRGRR